MKLEIRNLGVIEEAKIDIKPLTVFVGPNNAGKTWLAYTFSGILGDYGWSQYLRAYIADEVQDSYPRLDAAIQQVLEGGDARIDLVQFVEESGELFVNNVARLAKRWMREFMRAGSFSFERLEVHIGLAELKEEAKARVLQYSLNTLEEIGQKRRKAPINVLKEAGSPEMYLYTSTEGSSSEQPPLKVIKDLVALHTFNTLHRAFFTDKPIFPAERTTFITYPFSGARKQSRQKRSPDEGSLDEQKGRVLSEPLGSFLTMIEATFAMDSLDREKREEEAKSDEPVRTYMQLAQLLERQILQGSIDFSTPEPGPKRDLLFQPSDDITLEIPIASSMVKELSSLVLYLRYLAELGDWLIIDEPELNLHPEAQVKIMEFLAMLVNAGLRVLITTHSPNMIDHLENLIRAAAFEEEDKFSIANEFFLHRSDAFISQADVSIYLVDHKKAESILLEEGKINWGTFGDVSDRVAKIHYQL